MSMVGELKFFLGLQIKQTCDEIFINQIKYILDMLKMFEMNDIKPMNTPMSTSIKLDKDDQGISVDITKYRGMIRFLLYLTASRPDIMFRVCLCARFQSNPKKSHLKVVKRIFRYLSGTRTLGLWCPEKTLFQGFALVSWFSKKQNYVALSTAKVEYISTASCCAQVLWMKQTLSDYHLSYDHIPIMCDNTSAINLSKNPILHSRTKHIEIRHHFLKAHVQKGDIMSEFIDTENQLADIFTKL